ncbi:Cyclin-dependent kinase 1 [Cucumispora dikerogammari]|nr:Cyclin-dependent kinase 1 [Cucumispora dikerogammari]
MAHVNYTDFIKIGSGAYGTVYKANVERPEAAKELKEVVAIKKLNYSTKDEGVTSSSLREISVLKRLEHPTIIKLLDVFTHADTIYMVFPYYETDLKKYINSFLENGNKIQPSILRHFSFHMLKALNYLESQNVIHRDIKPQNFLINKKGDIVLADFGLNKTTGTYYKMFSKDVITLFYRSPEILLGSRFYGPQVDIWSLGCVFLEMILLRIVFEGENEMDQIIQIFKILGTPTNLEWKGVEELVNYGFETTVYKRKNLKSLLDADINFIDLIEKMLIYDPKKRITAKDALNHIYFN